LTRDEQVAVAREIARRLRENSGPCTFMIPRKGFDSYSAEGEGFWDPEADAAFVETLKAELPPSVTVVERDVDINDPSFADEMVYRIGAREVLPQVRDTPVVAGLNGVDVTRDMRLFLEDVRRIGFSGVHNFPTVAWFDGDFRATLEGTGLGFGMELDMLR